MLPNLLEHNTDHLPIEDRVLNPGDTQAILVEVRPSGSLFLISALGSQPECNIDHLLIEDGVLKRHTSHTGWGEAFG